MPIWEQLGMQAAGSALGLGLGLINDRRQLAQQQRLQKLEIQGSKELTDYNTAKQLQMWQKTSYPAQMEMMKKAGINPALMYGMGGGGGTTAQIAQGNVSGSDAPKGGGEVLGMGLMGQQAALIGAQTENIKASTEKTKAETQAVAPGIEKTQAETKSIIQGISNQQAQEKLLQSQTKSIELANIITEATSNAQIQQELKKLDILEQELHSQLRENKIYDATIDDKMKQIRAEAAGAVLQNLLTQAQTYKTHAETALTKAMKSLTEEETKAVIRNLELANQANQRAWDNETRLNTYERLARTDELNDNAFPKEIGGVISAIFGGILGSKLTSPAGGRTGFEWGKDRKY